MTKPTKKTIPTKTKQITATWTNTDFDFNQPECNLPLSRNIVRTRIDISSLFDVSSPLMEVMIWLADHGIPSTELKHRSGVLESPGKVIIRQIGYSKCTDDIPAGYYMELFDNVLATEFRLSGLSILQPLGKNWKWGKDSYDDEISNMLSNQIQEEIDKEILESLMALPGMKPKK